MKNKAEKKIKEWMKKNNCNTHAAAMNLAESQFNALSASFEASNFLDDVLYKKTETALRRMTLLKLRGTEWADASEWIDDLF